MKAEMDRKRFNVGDRVKVTAEFVEVMPGRDYELAGASVVTETKNVGHLYGTTGQWLKTDAGLDWIDAHWLELAAPID
jgi:hypothetical protein